MKDLLAKLAELDKDIKTINETTNPLGETASMNISMTGDNADEVAQLVNIMRTGNTPDAKAVSPMDMPPSDHMPMDKALSIVKMPMDGPMDMDGPMHGMDGPTDSPMDDMPQMDPKDDEADEDMSGGFSSSTTEPDEQYFDTQTMTHDLAGGINRTKKQHAPAADGDNPIAVEDDLDAQIESIKDELYAALAEKTGKDKESPPDYPDLDNDGNKEEPMSQAIAQRDDDEEDTDEADTSYSITGKSKEANAELARLAELSGVSAPQEMETEGSGMQADEVQDILAKHPKAAAALKQGADIMDHDDLYQDLYSYFANSGDMPYGTQKARDGDPYEWVHDKLDSLGLLGEEAVAEMDDGEITKDSVKKSVMKLLVDIAKTSKQYKGEITDDQVHYLGSLIHDFDVAGIETEKYSEIEKLFRSAADTERADMSMIQPAYAQAKNLDEEADLDEWETDPEEHNQAAIESWYDEVVSAITDRNITFPIADNEIQKIADDVVDDWSNGNGPDEHTILSIIDNENDQVNQDQKDEATLEHEATLEAIRNISFR